MSIKRILVPLPAPVDHTGEVETALTAAKTLGAHVEALFISSRRRPPLGRASAKWATEQERRPSPRNGKELRGRRASVHKYLRGDRHSGAVGERPARDPRWRHLGARPRGRTWKSPCSGPPPSTLWSPQVPL
jgi:hypothetical protein